MISVTYYSIKNWPSVTQLAQTHQLRTGWVQPCQASVSAVLSASLHLPDSCSRMAALAHVSVQKRKKKSGGNCNDSQVSLFYQVKQKLPPKPPAAREPCQSHRSRGWEHLWGEPQSSVYNSRLQSRAKALFCASWSQGQGCFHVTSTTRQSLCARVVGTVTRDWAAEIVVSEVGCPSLGASPLSHSRAWSGIRNLTDPGRPHHHLKSLPGVHGHAGEVLASVLERAATHLFIRRLRLGFQPPLGFSVVNWDESRERTLVSWASGCERPWRRQRRVRLMVCWREKGNIIRVSEGPFLPKGTIDSDDLLGRASMGRASVTRSPVFNMLSGISGADSPWGVTCLIYPNLGTWPGPREQRWSGERQGIRGEEERACLRLCPIHPSKATSSGGPSLWPWVYLPRGFSHWPQCQGGRHWLGLGKSPWLSALPLQHFSLLTITMRCTSGKAGGPSRTRSRALRASAGPRTGRAPWRQCCSTAEVRPPPSRRPDGFLQTCLETQARLPFLWVALAWEKSCSQPWNRLFPPRTSWGLLILKLIHSKLPTWIDFISLF